MAHSPKRSRNTVFLTIFASAAFSILLVCLSCSTSTPLTAPKIGDAFPKLSLTDLNGVRTTLPNDATGKIAVIHFMTTWCALCEREMLAMQLTQTLHGGKGLVSYWVHVGPSAEADRAYAIKTQTTYPVLLDPNRESVKLGGNLNIPTTYVCDRNGVIRGKFIGEVTQRGLEKLLGTLLQDASS